MEYFTLRCRSEEQLKQWETQITRLIKEVASRRASDRNISQFVAHNSHTSIPPSINPLPHTHDRTSSSMSHAQCVNSLPAHPASSRHRPNPYSSEEQFSVASHSSGGYRKHVSADGFEFDLDDEYEDYPPSGIPSSGRGTPLGSHRLTGQILQPDRESFTGYDHSRARTEDTTGYTHTQWRSANGTQPFPSAGSVVPSYRPHVTRMSSTTSATDASFGSGSRPPRIPLHTQISSQKLNSPYEQPDTPTSINSAPIVLPPSRSRSASQPSAYVPQTSPPPLPSTVWTHRSQSSAAENKRGSGSSQSTRGSSEESPNSSSPITPFGSSESSLAGTGLRQSRSQMFENMHNGHPPSVKVKVHFQDDIFVIQVPRSTGFIELVDKVGKKIRLCGPRRDDTPLRVKYKDEDGDLISLRSTEDVQMAFESFRPGGQVTLYVT